MKKNYLFIKNNDINFNLKNFEYTDIHFWNICNIQNKENFQNIYFYCRNIEEINYVLKNNYIPHIIFDGDNIFSSFYNNTLHFDFERFWLPEKKHLTIEFIQKFLKLSNINTTPIAIIYNPIFQSDISYQEFFSFIQLLNSQYKNPLFSKDLTLHEQEFFSETNLAIINGIKHFVVLGVFGDYYSLEKPTAQSINLGILKDKNCVFCDFAESCKNRGLGILKYENKISGCVGIKLFQQLKY